MPKFSVYFRKGPKEGIMRDGSGKPIATTFDRADSWAKDRTENYMPSGDVIFGVAEPYPDGKIRRIIKRYKNISGEIRTV